MEMTIQILAPELAAALNNLADALAQRGQRPSSAADTAPAAYTAPKAEAQALQGEAEGAAKSEKTATDKGAGAEEMRKKIKSLGVRAVRAKKTDAVRALLDEIGVTELKDIPGERLDWFRAKLEDLLHD